MVALRHLMPSTLMIALLLAFLAPLGSASTSVEVCVPLEPAPATGDLDGDGLPALYGGPGGTDLVVEAEIGPGTVHASAHDEPDTGACWMGGDPDDDGEPRAELPLPATTVCGPGPSTTFGLADRDHDGVQALYTNKGTATDYTLNSDGSVSTAPNAGNCWFGGDPDDDGTERLPASPVALPATTVCGPNPSSTLAYDDEDGDGLLAVYINANKASDYQLQDDGSLRVSPHQGRCWLAGDLDDDGTDHTPGLPDGGAFLEETVHTAFCVAFMAGKEVRDFLRHGPNDHRCLDDA